MGPFTRIWGRLQRPLRQSKAPHFRALTRAFARGTQMVALTSAVRSMYLDTARGRWLDSWADVFALRREAGELDGAFRSRIQEQALTRGDTRRSAVEAVVSRDIGLPVRLEATSPYVARYDNLEAMLSGGHFMADFERIAQIIEDEDGRWGTDPWGATPWGEPAEVDKYVFDDTPFNHLGYAGRTPLRPGWGAAGGLFIVGDNYSASVEANLIKSADRSVPAAMGYDIFWSHTFRDAVESGAEVWDDGFTYNESGYGVDAWGDSTWG